MLTQCNFFLSAGRLIKLLMVRECTATLLQSHYLVSKCPAHFLFYEDCRCPIIPLLLLDWTFRCCSLRTRVEVGGAASSNITVVQSQASRDRRLFSWLDRVKRWRREWETNKRKKERQAFDRCLYLQLSPLERTGPAEAESCLTPQLSLSSATSPIP